MVMYEDVAEQPTLPEGTVRVYVVGGTSGQPDDASRAFPVIEWNTGESQWSHVMRVARAVRKAVAAGGTHLLVPRSYADWFATNPLLIEYFAARHKLVEASGEKGLVFKLMAPGSLDDDRRGDA
jgi:hypothetical protein